MVTNASGQYRFALLQPGDYEVIGEATSLKSKAEKFTLLVEVQATATILQTGNTN